MNITNAMFDFALSAAVIVLVLVCLISARVALGVWLPNRRERLRLRAERVEHMLSDVDDTEMAEAA